MAPHQLYRCDCWLSVLAFAAFRQRLKAFKPQTIQVQLRPNNLLGRLGGEEFTIFMADTSLEAAYACAEQIRQHKSQTAISIDQQRHFFIQLSIGLCICMPENHQAIKHLFKQANDALYQAKRQGRNWVVIST